VQYLSQQAAGRLLQAAGIDLPPALPLPAKLREVQALMSAGDPRARKIYETLGVYLGYALAQFATVYDFRHVLLLGRVTSGAGGDVMLNTAREALRVDFPELASRVDLRMPNEHEKRHGQAIAAASLPDRGETTIVSPR
jgi:predicted NBD/HSP70 family sugar kinase